MEGLNAKENGKHNQRNKMHKKRTAFDGYKERIAQLEKQLQDIEEKKALEPFMQEFKECLAVQLAYTPTKHWSEREKHAFATAARKLPNASRIYVERRRELKLHP